MAALRTTFELAARNILLLETDTKAERWNDSGGARAKVLPMTDENRRPWDEKIGIKIADDEKQLELSLARSAPPPPLSLPPLFRAYPPSFPFHTHRLVATMADAAEHDEELVDYDEEEVG